MPRGRRKRNVSGSTRLRPLMFTESPVNIVHNMPSPVFSSDNPATADVVQLDDNTTVPWVSPQFLKAPPSVRRSRRSQFPASSLHTTRARTRSTLHDTTSKGPKVSDKYGPLHFLGNMSEASLGEEVNVDEAEFHNTVNHVNRVGEASNTKTGVSSPHKTPALLTENPELAPDIDTPLGMLGGLHENVCEPENRIPILSELEPNVVNQEPVSTQHRTTGDLHHTKPNRCLFHKKGNSFQTDQRSSSLENQGVNLCGDLDAIPQRKSLRLRRTQDRFFSDFQQCQTPERDRMSSRVLVYDTPEEQYGMSARQRRLLKVRSCKSSKTKT